MQVKKDAVRDALMESGMKEFLAHGFEGASLRKIVKNAGTTIGNFYNYFKSKEELFDKLVQPRFVSVLKFLGDHDDEEAFDFDSKEALNNQVKALGSMMTELFDDRFRLLVESSKGTKYATFKRSMIDEMDRNIMDHIEEGDIEINEAIAPVFSKSIAIAFMEGLFEVVKCEDENREEAIVAYMSFYIDNFLK